MIRGELAPEDQKVRRMREHASLEHGGRGTPQNQATRSSSGFSRNGLCCGIVSGNGNERDTHVSQSDESHAKRRCEQQERDSTHQSTREVALHVGGTKGYDESEGKHSQRNSA